MALALAEARAAAREGEVPVGAVAIVGGQAGGVTSQRARAQLPTRPPTPRCWPCATPLPPVGDWRLSDVTLVVTLEPCPMCAGALVAARVGRLVYGASDPRAGACGTLYNLCADPRLNHELAVTDGVLADECGALLTSFFSAEAAVRALEGRQTADSRGSATAEMIAIPVRPPRCADAAARRRGPVDPLTMVPSRPHSSVARAGRQRALPSLRTRSERVGFPPEECESGRIGRSRKPLCLMGTVGSNPTSSARGRRGPPHGRVRQEQRQGGRLAGSTWSLPGGRKGVNRGTRTFDIREIAARPGQEGQGQGEDGRPPLAARGQGGGE